MWVKVGVSVPVSGPLYLLWSICECETLPVTLDRILPLSVCLMDAGSGSLMEAAPCGCAAAGRLKLQVERVTACRRRGYSKLLYCSKTSPCLNSIRLHKKKKKGRNSMQILWFESVKFSWGDEIPVDFVTALQSPNTGSYDTCTLKFPAPKPTFYTCSFLLFHMFCAAHPFDR